MQLLQHKVDDPLDLTVLAAAADEYVDWNPRNGPSFRARLERRRRRGIYLMSIYHMCTTQQPKQEGWIVVGVDNILEHFIYRVLTHQRQNRGVAAKRV